MGSDHEVKASSAVASQPYVKGARVESAGPGNYADLKKLFTADEDARRWDDTPRPAAAGVEQQDFALILTLYTANPWVYSATHRCASAVSSVRRKYFKTGPDGVKKESKDTKLEKLLEMPNPFQTFEDLIELTIIDLKTIGWSWWEKIIDSDTKDVLNLWRLRPDRVKVQPDPERYWKGIQFERKLGDFVELTPEELVPFRFWSPVNDFAPVSGLFASQNSIIWELFARAWNTSFFRNGAASMPEGVFESEQKVDEDVVKRIEERIKNKIGHPEVWRSPLVLDQGLKYKRTGNTMNDLQFSQMMDKSRDEILATLGVPPAMVGIPISGGLGGFREQRHQFYQNTILPLIRKLQATINRFLATDGETFEFDLSDIISLIEDVEMMARTAEGEVTRGIRTINEVRNERGMTNVAWGDVWWAALGLAPVDGVGRPERSEGLGGAVQPQAQSAHPEEELDEKTEARILRRNFWKAAEGKLRRRMAKGFAGAYRTLFDQLGEIIERKLEEIMVVIEDTTKDDLLVAVVKQEPRFELTGSFDPFSEEDYRDLVRSTVGPEALKQTKGAAKVAARALGIDFRAVTGNEPVFRRIVDSWLNDRAGSTARTIAATVQKEIEQARKDGATPRQASRRMMAKFNRTVDNRIKDLSVSDSTTFSSTALSVQAEGKFTHKRWLHAADARNPARGGQGENHISEEFPSGPIVAIDDRFDVPSREGIARMEFPGDPAGSADVTSNCNCSVEFLSQEEAAAEGF